MCTDFKFEQNVSDFFTVYRKYFLECMRKEEYLSRVIKHLLLLVFSLSTVSLELGRFQVTEGLFHPEAWGLDNPGVQKLVHKAIQVRTHS